MKKYPALIWALILTVCLAGCGGRNAAPETTVPTEPAVTEAPTEAATEPAAEPAETAPEYPETLEVTVEEEPVTMELFDGGNYVIYFPKDEWTMETETADGYLIDRWTNVEHGSVTMEVISYGDLCAEAVEKRILVTEGAYHFGPEEEGYYGGLDNVRGRYMIFTIRSKDDASFALTAEYPVGATGDGLIPTYRAVMESFRIK